MRKSGILRGQTLIGGRNPYSPVESQGQLQAKAICKSKGTWDLVVFTAWFGGRAGWDQETRPELTHIEWGPQSKDKRRNKLSSLPTLSKPSHASHHMDQQGKWITSNPGIEWKGQNIPWESTVTGYSPLRFATQFILPVWSEKPQAVNLASSSIFRVRLAALINKPCNISGLTQPMFISCLYHMQLPESRSWRWGAL